ncbi:MAG: carboxypeptidase-like regulatory domain-containing protein [Pseudomonadota bacterium]|nr:carboxypeptidase-like regulatory domain-containing protein [Pseudomonadota bacterium]
MMRYRRAGSLLLGVMATTLQAAEVPSPESYADYQDRILSSERLAIFVEDQPAHNETGLPRSLNLEWLTAYSAVNDQTRTDHGLNLQAYWQTEQLGQFSLDATGFYQQPSAHDTQSEWAGRVTLWQRQFFLNDDWLSSHGMGVLTTLLPQITRNTSRIFLPTFGLFGMRGELEQRQSGQQLQWAIGQTGRLDGRQVAAFEWGDGQVYAFNWQQPISPDWNVAIALLHTNDPAVNPTQPSAATRQTTAQTALLSMGWQRPQQSIQWNLLHSTTEQQHQTGLWIDAQHRQRYTAHQYGWYYLPPDLNWAGLAMQQDAYGSYYRFHQQRLKWSISGGLDSLQSVSGQQFEGIYANSFARYQASSRTGYGGGITWRGAKSDDAYSAQAFWDQRHAYGQTRSQLDYTHAPQQQFESLTLNVDHALALQQGQHLSLSAGYQQLKQSQQSDQLVNLSAYGSLPLNHRLTIDGSARWSHSLQQQRQSIGMNLTANWQIKPNWQLSTTLYQNQSRFEPELILDPLQPNTTVPTSTQKDLSVLLRLRYQQRAGTAQQVLAGSARDPVGSIQGSIFLDDNQDGIRNANERGAAQVTVILNDVYSVLTDDQGRFEFPLVATGTHQLRVVQDQLPLPWHFSDGQHQAKVQVQVRQATQVDIPAIRMR